MDHQGKVVNLHCLLGEGKVVNLHTGLYIKELLYRRIQEVENKISTPSHICMVGNVVDANSFIGVHNAGDNQRGLLSVRGSTQKNLARTVMQNLHSFIKGWVLITYLSLLSSPFLLVLP